MSKYANTALVAAHEYLDNNWAVIPICFQEKKPRLENWPQLRLEKSDLADHFSCESNVGLLLGEPSDGLIDIDLDCKEAVALATEILPKTEMWSGHSGRPHSHAWYRVQGPLPDNVTFKDADRDKTVLVELRGTGRQTVIAPSIHPDGHRYQWEGPLDPAVVDGAELATRVRHLAAAALLVRHWPSVPSSRHDISNALCGCLLRDGWSETEVSRLLGAIARAANDEEAHDRVKNVRSTAQRLRAGGRVTGVPTLVQLLGKGVVDRFADWIGLRQTTSSNLSHDWTPPAAFHAPNLPEFPVDALPGWLRRFVEAEAEATQTPLALAGGLALVSCALTIAGRLRIRIRSGWEEPLNLFIVTVLDPGNRKSAVFGHVTAPVFEHEKEEGERMEPEIREAEAKHRVLDLRLREAEKKAAKAKPDEREALEYEAIQAAHALAEHVVPTRPRLIADDVTPEKLAGLMCQNEGRFGVLSAEGGIFEMLAGRYSTNQAPNLDVFLKGHAGDPLRVDRVGRPAEHIDQPALTVGLAVQRDVLRSLAAKPGFRGRGLLARFLFAVPASSIGTRRAAPSPVPDVVKSCFCRNVLGMLRLRVSSDFDPRTIAMSSAAERRLRELEVQLEPRMGADGDLVGLIDWASKLAGAVARIAGILHLAAHAADPERWTRPVDIETVNWAIQIGEFYLAHARAAFAEMGADPEVENAKHVLRWIERKAIDSFSERDAYQGLKGRFKKVNELRPGLRLLEEHGYVRIRPESRDGKPGRRPSPVYEVNPYLKLNCGDIGDIGDVSLETNLESLSSSEIPKSVSETHPQNPHNPQNSPEGNSDDAAPIEVFEI